MQQIGVYSKPRPVDGQAQPLHGSTFQRDDGLHLKLAAPQIARDLKLKRHRSAIIVRGDLHRIQMRRVHELQPYRLPNPRGLHIEAFEAIALPALLPARLSAALAVLRLQRQ
ncbi:hypothetical protein D3C81_1462090 [compost metagenome]